ncbi:hypothetical protein NQ315_007073 [Exocentrus adspersus]|uniref:HAT C-terminal dimerisation domain-containing protein n=1 Tax=Exocentrus adspersus TaxID=1586481 RepID=A0AAV8WEY6_9CUCU|nr:hypothetical protein NQ315_007073 [Exocentrus adspersus]
MSEEINSVQYLLKNWPIPYEQKLLVKEKGRPTPILNISYMNTALEVDDTTDSSNHQQMVMIVRYVFNGEIFEQCLERLRDEEGVDNNTINEACGLLNHLTSPEFLYWLKLFNFIMPHVEVFFLQCQTHGIENMQLEEAVAQFETQIIRIRSITGNIRVEGEEEPPSKKQRTSFAETRAEVAKEVCNNIRTQIKDRFNFKKHLAAVKLFDSKNFQTYRQTFPTLDFSETVVAYPLLNIAKLKTELDAIYNRDDMCAVDGVLPLLTFINDNNLKKVFSETYKLLDIICTTPMATTESERCFSTLQRVKTFLRSTVTEDRLDALAILATEKKFIQSIPDFDNKVIEVFCNRKEKSLDFLYK